MRNGRIKMVASAGLALALVLVGRGLALAEPAAATGCVQTCKNHKYFVIVNPDAVGCLRFERDTCFYCATANCRCLPNSSTAICDPLTGIKSTVWYSNIETCTTPCPTVLTNGWTEANTFVSAGTSIGMHQIYECE